MTRDEIVIRINQKMYEELYAFDDIKYDLDDAIIAINNTMHSKFPMISDEMTLPDSTYEIFPDKYLRSVVIEFTVASLYRRQGEFGPEYQSASRAYEQNLAAMFQEHYSRIPDEYNDELAGIMPITPIELEVEKEADGTPIPGTEPDLWDPGDY